MKRSPEMLAGELSQRERERDVEGGKRSEGFIKGNMTVGA